MSDYVIYGVGAAVAIILIVGLRWLASRHAAGVHSEAVAAMTDKLGEAPDFVQAFGASAVGLYFGTRSLIVFERGKDLTSYTFDDVGTWFVGTVTDEFLSPQAAYAISASSEGNTVAPRKTETKYVIVTDQSERRICQIGIMGDQSEEAALSAFQRAMPDKQNFEATGAKDMSDLLSNKR